MGGNMRAELGRVSIQCYNAQKTTQDIAGNLTIYIKLCYLVTDVYKNLQPKIQEV